MNTDNSDSASKTPLEALDESLLKGIADSTKPSESISAALAILNASADLQKKRYEAADAATSKRNELWKTFATAVVPLLTVLTLGVTIYFQWDQARITSRANEDAQWRAVSDAFTKPVGPTTDIVITTALLPFYDSPRYRDQAYEITFLLANRISSLLAFKSLFRGAFGGPSWNNIGDMERLGLALNTSFADVDEFYTAIGGNAKREEELKHGMNVSMFGPQQPTAVQVAHSRDAVLDCQHFLSEQVATVLRTHRPKEFGNVDLTAFPFLETDLTSADFSNVNLTDAVFTRVNLKDARMNPRHFDRANFSGTAWWMANSVSKPLLQYLLANYPMDFGAQASAELKGTQTTVQKSDYQTQVYRLCLQAGLDCAEHKP